MPVQLRSPMSSEAKPGAGASLKRHPGFASLNAGLRNHATSE